MSTLVESRLKELGLVLPEVSNPAGSYANYVVVNGMMFVSGKGPSGKPKGKLGKEFTAEEGYQFAREAAIEVLAVVKDALGTLDRVKRVVKVQGFINAVPEFEEHAKVLNGYSDLMYEVFADKGVHARSVLGAISVRDNLPIIVDSIFLVEE
ncbi:RidA family protein [Paenibacillus assamensis]|uniref:RidA family protein n=1 Tax=Paenibacillus assamensis TaxID=311244 RepID=UPI0003FCC7A9|nr:RidA family protein [Paenibacillus assamensis]